MANVDPGRVYEIARIGGGREPDIPGKGQANLLKLAEGGMSEADLIKTVQKEGFGNIHAVADFGKGLGLDWTPDSVRAAQQKDQESIGLAESWSLYQAPKTTAKQPTALSTNKPKSTAESNSTVDQVQTNLDAITEKLIEPEVQSPGEVLSELQGDNGQQMSPTDYLELGLQEQEKFGMNGLMAQQNQIKGELDDVYARKDERIANEYNKRTWKSVAEGRISEVERQENLRIDTLGRALSRINDQINTANNSIALIMDWTKMSYEESSDYYNTKFNQNVQVQNIIADQKKAKNTFLTDEREFLQEERKFETDEERYQKEEQQALIDKEQSIAAANFTTMSNLITSGNLSYSNMSSSQKAQFTSTAVKAGLPANIGELVQMNPGDQVLITSPETGQITFMDSSGRIRVEDIPGFKIPPKSGGSGGGTAGERAEIQFQQDIQDMITELTQNAGSDNYVSPTTWNKLRQGWVIDNLGDQEDFDIRFIGFVNPVHAKQWVEDYNLTREGKGLLGI